MASISSSRLRILVADDSRSTALAFTRLLEAKGHKVQAVLNGLAAVDAMAEFKPHIVLLDVGMPALDGHAVTRKIRDEQRFEGPIVIISGHGSDDDKRLSLEAGANYHLVKPIDFDVFWGLLDELAQTTVHDSAS
jgi:DNA-binding response OmpR family regulator